MKVYLVWLAADDYHGGVTLEGVYASKKAAQEKAATLDKTKCCPDNNQCTEYFIAYVREETVQANVPSGDVPSGDVPSGDTF